MRVLYRVTTLWISDLSNRLTCWRCVGQLQRLPVADTGGIPLLYSGRGLLPDQHRIVFRQNPDL